MESYELLKLLEEIKKLQDQVTALSLKDVVISDEYESKETHELATAFAKAQAQYRKVGLNRENPFFKSGYADLDAIIDSVSLALSGNGLAFYQYTQLNDKGETILHSKLKHASGQWISSQARIIPIKNDPQSYGSALSYQKRYQAQTLLRVTISADWSDDDAEREMHEMRHEQAKGTALNTKYNPKEQSVETITKEQLEELHYELAEYADLAEQILEGFKIQNLCDLPKSKFLLSINRIRDIKNLRNGKK